MVRVLDEKMLGKSGVVSARVLRTQVGKTSASDVSSNGQAMEANNSGCASVCLPSCRLGRVTGQTAGWFEPAWNSERPPRLAAVADATVA